MLTKVKSLDLLSNKEFKKAYNIQSTFDVEYFRFIQEHEHNKHIIDETLHLIQENPTLRNLKDYPQEYIRLRAAISENDGQIVYMINPVDSEESITLAYPENYTKEELDEIMGKNHGGYKYNPERLKKIHKQKILKTITEENPYNNQYIIKNNKDPEIRMEALRYIKNQTILIDAAFNDPDYKIRYEAIEKIQYNPELLIELADKEDDLTKELILVTILANPKLYEYLIEYNPYTNYDNFNKIFKEKSDKTIQQIKQKNNIIKQLNKKIEKQEPEKIEKLITEEYKYFLDYITQNDNYTLQTITNPKLIKAIIQYNKNQTTLIKIMKNPNLKDEEYLKEIALKHENAYMRRLAIRNPNLTDMYTLEKVILNDNEASNRKLAEKIINLKSEIITE